MLATYADFLAQNPNCKKYTNDADMIRTFNFLSQSFVLVQLIEASDVGKPAIAPVVENIEHIFAEQSREHTYTLDDDFTKQSIGKLIKTILAPFGYTVFRQNILLPKRCSSTKFISASSYRRNPEIRPTMRVVKTIEEV